MQQFLGFVSGRCDVLWKSLQQHTHFTPPRLQSHIVVKWGCPSALNARAAGHLISNLLFLVGPGDYVPSCPWCCRGRRSQVFGVDSIDSICARWLCHPACILSRRATIEYALFTIHCCGVRRGLAHYFKLSVLARNEHVSKHRAPESAN